MAEIRDLSFLIDSPEYKQNAAFVTACYKEMLDRDIDAEELFRWCRQLDGVYSRKSLIAALSGSEKFSNRFEIKDIDQYKKSAFIPRAAQHIINRINTNLDGYDKGCFGIMPHCSIKFDYPEYTRTENNWSDELDMLSLCQIETLRKQIEQLKKRFGSIRCIGEIAGDIIDSSDESSEIAFITSVNHIVRLISNEDSELRQINNLLIPIPVPSEKNLAVIFDTNWSASTKGKNPRRWLVSRKTGCILVLNNHEYPVAVKLSFNLTTLIKGSSVRIRQGQHSTIINLKKKAAHIVLRTFMLPGGNFVEFEYIGTADEVNEITNLAVSRFAINGEKNDMSNDMNRLGSGYYAIAFPDKVIRNALHQIGYSEIECIRLYHDNSIQKEATTRFLQHDPNSSGDSFFVLNKGEEQENTSTSVRLYIAKKTGEIK